MIVPNNTKGIYDWDLKNKSFGVEVTYSCPTEGWGYPSNGLNTMKSVCQADKSWTITSMDDCMRQSKSLGDKTFLFTTFFSVLPCPNAPPEKPVGGWQWYDVENTRYKCPNGWKFEQGNYPYWYSNCTIAKVWDPNTVETCIRKIS